MLRATQWASREEILVMQERRFQAVVEQAVQHVPAYARRFATIVGPCSLRDITNLPTLNKQQLREDHSALHHRAPPRLCMYKTTGGSTGEPVTVRKTRQAMAWELAATWRGYEWAGVAIGDRQARFWGVPLTASARSKAKLTDFICHRRRFSAFNFTEGDLEEYSKMLSASPVDYFYGYASMIAEFARWHLSCGRSLRVAPKAVITTSEVLAPDDREAIESAFDCRVYNEYGCGELGTIAHECEHGRLHVNDENLIVEILDGDRTCGPGEKGEIVVTELNNVALPLIRYRTGDFGAISAEFCPCGRSLGVLDGLFGRAYDFILMPDGTRYHAEFLMYVFEEAQRQHIGVSQFRVIQTTIRSLRVEVVPAPTEFSKEDEIRLVQRMRELLGDDMDISVVRIASIPREASGKMRVIVGLESSIGGVGSDMSEAIG